MIETALLVGGAFGVRHAFEPDHVAAVSTLIDGDRRSASTGAAWGVGHSLPVVALGAAVLLSSAELPAGVARGFELLVAAVLVALGVRAATGREAAGVALLRRLRGEDAETAHGRDRNDGATHGHLRLAGRRIGLDHTHADGTSFAVGVIHGLAGSGGVVVALVAASPTAAAGAGFLAGFVAATVVSMALASWGWGHAVGRTGRLRVVAGVASVVVGLLLLADVTGLRGPL